MATKTSAQDCMKRFSSAKDLVIDMIENPHPVYLAKAESFLEEFQYLCDDIADMLCDDNFLEDIAYDFLYEANDQLNRQGSISISV
jgi:hypothetical protein